jgi:hypothetical protein
LTWTRPLSPARIAIGILLVCATIANAAPIPDTAHSGATATPSELLPSDALLFRFPQRASRAPLGFNALDATSSRASAFSGRSALGRLRLFYGSNRRFDSPVVGGNSMTLLQVGSAVAIGAVDACVAFAWSTDGRKESFSDISTDVPMRRRTETFFDTIDYREFLVGAGWVHGGVALDVSLAMARHWLRHERTYSVLSLDILGGTTHREQSLLDVDTGYHPEVALRADLDAGNWEVALTGLYAEAALIEKSEAFVAAPYLGELVLREESYSRVQRSGVLWSVGALAKHPIVHRSMAHAFARFERDRRAPEYPTFRFTQVSRQFRIDRAQVGLGLEVPLRQRWALITGLGVSASSTRRVDELIQEQDRAETRWTDEIETTWGWGVRCRFRQWQVTARLRTPSLAPFSSVDLSFLPGRPE